MTEILTIEELGTWLKLSRSQIYSLTRNRAVARMQNPLPVLRINSNIRFRRSDIEKWLDKISEEKS